MWHLLLLSLWNNMLFGKSSSKAGFQSFLSSLKHLLHVWFPWTHWSLILSYGGLLLDVAFSLPATVTWRTDTRSSVHHKSVQRQMRVTAMQAQLSLLVNLEFPAEILCCWSVNSSQRKTAQPHREHEKLPNALVTGTRMGQTLWVFGLSGPVDGCRQKGLHLRCVAVPLRLILSCMW